MHVLVEKEPRRKLKDLGLPGEIKFLMTLFLYETFVFPSLFSQLIDV